MADSSPLAGLLDRASHVFNLAWQLGRTFQEEREISSGLRQIDPTSWSRHQPAFNKFCNEVLDLRDAMQNPPDGFGPIAQALFKVAGVAKTIRDTMQTADGQTWAAFLDFSPELNSVAAAGREAIQEVTKARRLGDPFAFLEQAKPPHSQHPYLALDRFARTVCNSELTDLTSRLPPHPMMTDHRRQEYRNEGDRLASQANEFAARKRIPFGEHDQLLRALGGHIMSVMNLMGRTWWPTNSEETMDATKELRQRLESCREASLSLLRFAEYHGCPLPKEHPGDGNAPTTWDEVFVSLSAWEEQVESSSATNQELADAGGFIERLLAGPDNVELSPHELALLEAHLRQPVSFATIQQEKKAMGHSPTEAARSKLTQIRDFNRGLQGQGNTDDPAPSVVQSERTPAASPGTNVSLALMRVFTNGVADERIEKATRLLADNQLTVNEKLTKIDALIPFPATASAEQLGEMLGVTKQAVLKTDWWIQNRKGEKESEVGRRREGHRKRAKTYEAPGQDDDE